MILLFSLSKLETPNLRKELVIVNNINNLSGYEGLFIKGKKTLI